MMSMGPILLDQDRSAFRKSRWFTRGWTLEELIAPSTVEFYSSNEHRLGDKKSLMRIIHEITKLPLLVLQGHWKSEIPMITRFSWFRQRNTTRPEDKAYCLMGILGVYMPPIYGEGEDEAFIRLYKDLEHRYQVKPGYTRLEMAARTSHETLLALLLKAGATINSKDPKGFTPLARAAEYGHEVAVQVLLNQGAKIELKNKKDFSPLSIAAWKGHETVIRVLLGAGADTESRDYDRDTPLSNAAHHGHTAAIRALIDGGAKINPTNKYGHTPLRRAAQNGHKIAARVVQNAGAR